MKLKGEFKVIQLWDGCPTNNKLFTGSYEGCKNFLRNMSDRKWNAYHEGKSELWIVNSETGRLVSFSLGEKVIYA